MLRLRLWLAQLLWEPMANLENEIRVLELISKSDHRVNQDMEREIDDIQADLEDCEDEHGKAETQLESKITDLEDRIEELLDDTHVEASLEYDRRFDGFGDKVEHPSPGGDESQSSAG